MARATVWIGGSTGSGKTTVTRILAARHGLRVFPIDAFWYSHVRRLRKPADDPSAGNPSTGNPSAGDAGPGERSADENGADEPSPDEQWLGMTPAEQAADFEALTRKRWPLVLADLDALPPDPPVIVEGPQVLPDLIPPGDRAYFLVGTAEWQRDVLAQRPLPATADPPRALANRIEKDRLYGERVVVLARARGFPVILVDGSRKPEEIADEITGLPEPGPRPGVSAARRWENRIVADNIRSWLASSHRTAELPEAWPFACECGRSTCTVMVPRSLPEFDASKRVRADGH
ncbi:hypothetical protein [Actinoplanes sp. NPDC051411]|uniref:hypothetical protein n=1 Tax=Actinoplanes sp. NPDC051411 TaxID=3155522 RepID=UPI00341E6D10